MTCKQSISEWSQRLMWAAGGIMLVRNVRGAKNRVAFACTELIGLSSPPN